MKVYTEDYSVRGLDYTLVLVLIRLSASLNLPIRTAEISSWTLLFFYPFSVKLKQASVCVTLAMPVSEV